MDKQIKTIIKYAVILFIITSVSAALLAFVNVITIDKIAENSTIATTKALYEVMPDAADFESLDKELCISYGAEEIYIAKDSSGSNSGMCFKMAKTGYGGNVVSIIGVDKSFSISGIKIISHAETPGLGARIINKNFTNQFLGKGIVNVVKAGAEENEINALTGATISSKALALSSNSAIEIAKKLQEEGIIQ